MPPGVGQRLEDLDGVALEPRVEGAGEAGRAGADDGDRLAAVGLGLDRQQQLAGLLLVQALVGHEAVQPADRDRVLDELAAAGAFAGPRADAAEDGRERQILAQLAHAGLVVAVGDGVEELRDLDVRRAGVAAGRRAERVVVGQQQLEVEVAHLAHLLGVGEHDHAVGGGRRAARHGLARALDLDHADAAGGRGRQPRLVAERGDVDAEALGRFEDRLAAVAGHLLAVDGQGDLGDARCARAGGLPGAGGGGRLVVDDRHVRGRFGIGRRGGRHARPHLDGVEVADLAAGVALDAEVLVDHVHLLLLAGDGAGRALLGAERAAGAVAADVVGDERLAAAGRAALVVDVRFVFVAEVLAAW